jgi:ribosomal protein S12 methylthiotransferase accessory factor
MTPVKYVTKEQYKACSPDDTVKKIREILYEINFFVVELAWFRDKNSWASLGLGLEDLPINTNGKGATEKYALASAYAEFMERLQNLMLVNTELAAGNQTVSKARFKDEVPFNYRSFKNEHFDILKGMFNIGDFTQVDQLLNDLTLHARPYYNVNKKKIDYLPSELLLLSTGSNGMCAGNSTVEAIIQGISEICERYVLKEMYHNPNLLFPRIPDEFMQQFPQWEYLEKIKSHGYEVYVKDCSMGGKVPVAGVLVKKGDKALFNLGASPDFSIAVQRCITEMFQGFQLDSLDSKLQPITTLDNQKSDRIFEDPNNRIAYQYYKSLRSYMGVVSPMVFDNSMPFNSENIFLNDDLAHKNTLTELLNIIKKLDCEIYIRDVSFLGFPSYHVYIPGMSEIIHLNEEQLKNKFKDIPKARKTFYNLPNSTNEDIINLANTLEATISFPYIDKSATLKSIHNLMFKEATFIENIDPENLLVMLYYKLGDVQSAYRVQQHYLKQQLTTEQYNNPPSFAFEHVCLLKFLEMLKNGKTLEEGKQILQDKFPEKIITDVYDSLQNPIDISTYFGIPDCVNCENCQYKQACCLEQIKKLAGILQERIDGYSFDQKLIEQYVS